MVGRSQVFRFTLSLLKYWMLEEAGGEGMKLCYKRLEEFCKERKDLLKNDEAYLSRKGKQPRSSPAKKGERGGNEFENHLVNDSRTRMGCSLLLARKADK